MGEAKRKRLLSESSPKEELSFSNDKPDTYIHLIGEGATVNIPFNWKEMKQLKTVVSVSVLVSGIGRALISHDYQYLPMASLLYLKQTQTFEQATKMSDGELHFLTTFFWTKNKDFLARPCGVVDVWNEKIIHQLWNSAKQMFNPIQYHQQSRVHHLLRNGVDGETVKALMKDYYTHILEDGEITETCEN